MSVYHDELNRIVAKANPETGAFGAQWSRFTTHVPKTANKFAMNKYVKIGGNSIVYGSLQRFSRNAVNENLRSELKPVIEAMKKVVEASSIDMSAHRWYVRMVFAVHMGYGSVGIRKTKKGLVISGGEDVTEPNWDIDNQWIWMKMFLDAAQEYGLLKNDTVRYVVKESKEFVHVKNFSDRYLKFVLSPVA
jgi:hypothetical protein